VNDRQRRTAQAIVNIFETGRAVGDYGAVTFLRGDPGHLTYGRSQTTLASGNLFLLVLAYCERPDAEGEIAGTLRRFLPGSGGGISGSTQMSSCATHSGTRAPIPRWSRNSTGSSTITI
jgi:hypothetical protein